MSYFKGLFESLGAFLSGWGGGGADEPLPIVHGRGNQTMESALPSVENDRVVHKLKAYFELAKEEIAKAVRAEEWGLVDDAILHYKNAQRVLLEAKATRVPPLVSSSNQEQAKTYHKKILKWEGQVLERLQVLSQRADATLAAMSTNKTSLNNAPTRAVPAARSGPKKAILSKPSYSQINNSVPMKRGDITGSSRSNKEAGNDYDAKLVETINSVIVDRSPSVKWEDIAGLEKAKQTLLEMVILPTKRRDLFTGLRKPARGLLLFGPPGNGKTMLAKAVASESEATFFNVSASTLTSKWVGEAEKLVRSLFTVAVARQPSVIFIDEIDSILSARMANENDASRRLKSEFLVQFDGVTSSPNDLVIVIGATNKPQELDDAVLRRLVKRIYVPLPNVNVRRLLLKHQLKGQAFSLPDGDLERLVKETEVYSGSDLQALCEEAALMPIRELGPNILTVKANQVRRLRYEDFQKSISVIRPSLSKSMKEELEKWNEEFGSN